MCGAWEICTAAEAVEAQMVETAVLIYVCLHKSVRQGDSEQERERGKIVHPCVCGVKLTLSSAQYFGTLV